MIFATSTVETRITRPIYFQSNNDDAQMMVSVQKGKGVVSPVPAASVKVTLLSTGKYSIRCIGGGFRKAVHVSGGAWLTLTTTDGSLAIIGTVADVFARGEKSTGRRY